jgi:hypothetical protein
MNTTQYKAMASAKLAAGPGSDDQAALAHRLPIEGAFDFFGRDFALAFVQHLDVTAQRKDGDRPFGAVLAQPALPEGAPEPD